MSLCLYYQAHVVPHECWFLVAVLRSFEHLAFDRTYDVHKSIFEFFVSPDSQEPFLELMSYFEREGIVTTFQQLPNRLADPAQQV